MNSHPSFTEYRSFLKKKKSGRVKNKDYYLKNHTLMSEVANLIPCGVYVLNYQSGNYLFVSDPIEDVLHFSANELLRKGNAFFASLMHEDDFRFYSEKILREFIRFCKETHIGNLCFSFSYRMRRKDGVYIKIHQQFCIAEVTEDNFPLIAVGFITDISHLKKDDEVTYSVTDRASTARVELITQESFADAGLNISKREIEVLKKLVNGLTSKEIADQLFISPFTVSAHRRNLMSKTESKSTAELIGYAIKTGVI